MIGPTISWEMMHISLGLTFKNSCTVKNTTTKNNKIRYEVEICAPCGNNSRANWPMLAVVSLWPLICLKSPKQQRGEATFYCASMRKGDRANLAWWMGSNWVSKAGIKELHPTIKLPASSLRAHRTSWVVCECVGVCVSGLQGSYVIRVIHTGCDNLIENNTVLESSWGDRLFSFKF